MENSKILIAHVVTEVIVIAGVAYFFNKQNNELRKQITELKDKITVLEKNCENTSNYNPLSSNSQLQGLNEFKQQTQQHINNLYSIIKQMNGEAKPMFSMNPQTPKPTVIAAVPSISVTSKAPNPMMTSGLNMVMGMASKFMGGGLQSSSSAQIEELSDDEDVVNNEDLDKELKEELEDLEEKFPPNPQSILCSSELKLTSPPKLKSPRTTPITPIKSPVSSVPISNDIDKLFSNEVLEIDTPTETNVEFIPIKPKKKKVVK